jgi:streptogramin lyase
MAHLHEPTGLAVDPRGTLFIADGGDNRIRKVDTTGIITTVAGSGLAGSAGDGGPANLGQLAQPRGVAVDGQGNIFVADTGNFLIRRIDAVSGILTTVAGNGKPARAVEGTIPVPHGLPATRAALEAPWAVALDSQGNLFIAHGVISEVVAVSGLIWTVAGSGRGPISREEIAAQMATIPANQAQTAAGGLALTSTGNIVIADTGNRLVRVLTLPK